MRPVRSITQRGTRPGRSARTLAAGCVASVAIAGAATAATPATIEVEVDGVAPELARRAVETAGLHDLDCAAAPWAVRFRGGRLRTALQEALRDEARLAPQITISQQLQDDCWTVRAHVDPGPATLLRSVAVSVHGEGRDALAAVLREQALVPGEPLDEGRYEALKRRLHERATSLGFLAARFTEHRIDAYPDISAADVTLVLETGSRHYFEDLTLTVTPDRLDADIVERVLDWPAGEPWSLDAMGDLRRRLLASGYVDRADLRSEPDAEGGVRVAADLELRQRHRVGGGLGFATDVGPRAEISYEDRYANRRGHQRGAELNTSSALSGLHGEYRLPLAGRDDPWLHLEAGISRESTDTVEADSIIASVRRVHSGPLGSRMTEFLELSRERFEVALDDETARLVVFGVVVDRRERTASEPLELGWRLRASLRGAAQPLSTTDYLQGLAETELALRAGDRGRLILRGTAGATLTSSLAQLPSSARFFAGGDRSIRGYGLDDVGPLAANGEVRGGRHLLIGALEYERLVRGRWSAAAFVDSGSAFNDRDDPWVTGLGLGVRWRSPLGPLRIDLAVPLDDPKRELRLHVGVGALFR